MPLKMRALLFIVPGLALASCSSAPQFPISDHCDGHEFHNYGKPVQKGFWDLLKWQLTSVKGPWPEWVEIEKIARPTDPVPAASVRVTWINHATSLLEFPEGSVLTDPIYSERASPVGFAGPKRVHAPGVAWEALPKISAVVVSHSHYDHMDLPTLERLAQEHRPVFVVGLGNARVLRGGGPALKDAEIRELDWWQETVLQSGLQITLTPAQHWSMRSLSDRNKALWGGYWIRGKDPQATVYFAGDTGMGRHFEEIPQKLGKPRVSLLPIGAYTPRWFMKEQHIDPNDAVQAYKSLGSLDAIGIHFGTFRLADEGRDDPESYLKDSLTRHEVDPKRFLVPKPGQWVVFRSPYQQTSKP